MGGLPLRQKTTAGFTLLEAVVGIALIALAVLGLAEMFTVSVMNNMRSEKITNGSFLVQQQVDMLRGLTANELNLFAANGTVDLNGDGTNDLFEDELIDINLDTFDDYRRITEIQLNGNLWEVQVLVFSVEQFGEPRADLLANPQDHQVRARVITMIHRA